MKRTCNGCKALNNDYCELNYKTKKIYHEKYIELTIDVKPLENCPKPKTNDEYVKLYFNNMT